MAENAALIYACTRILRDVQLCVVRQDANCTGYYTRARFRFSIASSISAVFL